MQVRAPHSCRIFPRSALANCPEVVGPDDRQTSPMKEASSQHDGHHMRRENERRAEARGAVDEPLTSGTRRWAARPAPRTQASLQQPYTIIGLTVV